MVEAAGRSWIAVVLVPALALWWVTVNRVSWSPVVVILFCLVRLALILADPGLSEDVWRYLRDGVVSSAGSNPYAVAPESDPADVRRESPGHHLINHAGVRTIYPPYAQALFMISTFLSGGVIVWKLLVVAGDLAVAALFARRRARLGVAWLTCPLVVWEGAWNGHVDLVAGVLVVLALIAVRGVWARGVLLALGAGIKVAPLVVLPFASSALRRALIAWSVAALVLLLGALPFLGQPFMPGLSDYVASWSFNSPVYEGVLAIITFIDPIDEVKRWWTSAKDLPGLQEASADRVYAMIYPEMLTRLILGFVFAVGLVVIWRREAERTASACSALGLLLVLSPTIHPWYWLMILPLALATGGVRWVAIAVFSPFSYLLYGATPPVVVWLLCYGLPLAAAQSSCLRERVMSLRIAAAGSSRS